MGEWQVRHRVKQRRRTISSLLTKVEERLDEVKPTVVDYIRLTQLERELEDKDQPVEVKVTWVDPTERSGIGE